MTTFEKLEPKDIPQILQMMETFYAIDQYPIDTQLSAQNFETFIQHPAYGQAFIIRHENKIAGYIIMNFLFSFEFGGLMSFLDELFISDEMRGKGIGKQAVAFVQQYAQEKELKMLFLEVEPHNIKAQELYKKAGWQHHTRSIMTFKP